MLTKQVVDMERVTVALAEFRREARASLGTVYTRQDFYCCGGCASDALLAEIKATNAKGKRPVVGGVYYHKQDGHRVRNGGSLFLNYGGVDIDGDYDISERSRTLTKQIGDLLVGVLRKNGLEVVWDGNVVSRIEVVGQVCNG